MNQLFNTVNYFEFQAFLPPLRLVIHSCFVLPSNIKHLTSNPPTDGFAVANISASAHVLTFPIVLETKKPPRHSCARRLFG
jgi:hypothetical protein